MPWIWHDNEDIKGDVFMELNGANSGSFYYR